MADFDRDISTKNTGLKDGEWLKIYVEYSQDLQDAEILCIGEIDGRGVTAARKLYGKTNG